MAAPVRNHTPVVDSAERSIEQLLAPFLADEQARRTRLSEAEVRQVSLGLNHIGKDAWSRVPRLYVVLRMVKNVHVIDDFIDEGVSDIWFPFSHKTLPDSLRSASARFEFLELQDLVLTKAFDLEREDGKHRHFSKAEDIPLKKVAELGKGGFGFVDRVVSTVTYKQYARKLIPRGRTFKKNAEVLKDFERELGHLKKLSHHHIVELIGSYTDPRFVGILMAPVADCNLKDFMSSASVSSEKASFLRTFYGCLAAALCYLHENRVRHKDIKPQNVLVKGHQVFLTDFGVSLDWSDLGQSTTTGVTIRTPRYCAPEVAEYAPRNTLSDVWSLGCVFLEIWTVLKGASLASLLSYLEESGSRSTCYYLNTESAMTWCRDLQAKDINGDEDRPMQWILGMLQGDQDRRWTAQILVDRIQDATDDPELRYLFCGTCCIGDDDSTNSGYSSKRSSRLLEETGASSVEVYYDKAQRKLGVERESSLSASLVEFENLGPKATISTEQELFTSNEATSTPDSSVLHISTYKTHTVPKVVEGQELDHRSVDISHTAVKRKPVQRMHLDSVSAERQAMSDNDAHHDTTVYRVRTSSSELPSASMVRQDDVHQPIDIHGSVVIENAMGDQLDDPIPELGAAHEYQPVTSPSLEQNAIDLDDLSDKDFARCTEPWAKSSLLSWIMHAAGHRPQSRAVISGALIALFQHKVEPLSLIAAESIADNLIDDMMLENVLKDTEYGLCFASGTICGVLWQLTNGGCYATHPYLAPEDKSCYSFSCMKTCRRMSPVVSQQHTSNDWSQHYNLTRQDMEGHDRKEIQRQHVLHEIVTSEEHYLMDLNVLREVYRNRLAALHPPVIPVIRIVFSPTRTFKLIDEIESMSRHRLLSYIQYRQKMTGPWIVGFSDIFREWLRSVRSTYVEYAKTYPQAEYVISQERDQNPEFRQFLRAASLEPQSNRLGWEHFLKAPIVRFRQYIILLATVLKLTTGESPEMVRQNLVLAIEEMKAVLEQLDAAFIEGTKTVSLLAASQKISLSSWKGKIDLALHHPNRKLLMEGVMHYEGSPAFEGGNAYAFLFDNYFVLTKPTRQRFTSDSGNVEREVCEVLHTPIAVDLLSLEKLGQPVSKRSLKPTDFMKKLGSIGRSSSSKPVGQSVSVHTSDDNQDPFLYPMSIKALGKWKIYTLFAPSAASRQRWCETITEAQKHYAKSIHEHGDQPFRLRVLADEAFTIDPKRELQKLPTATSVALDEALQEVESYDLPLQTSQSTRPPNCAVVFYRPDGHLACLIGTDDGVYISRYDDPRSWRRWMSWRHVTHIAFLEGFDMFVIVADEVLRTYTLKEVCGEDGRSRPIIDTPSQVSNSNLARSRDPGCFAAGKMNFRTVLIHIKQVSRGSSTIHIMEPISLRARNLGSEWEDIMSGPQTEENSMLRHVEVIKAPSKVNGINIFDTTLAMLTDNGVKVMSLNSKSSWTVPNLRSESAQAQRAVNDIAAPFRNSKALGIFRLSEVEFVIAYEDCAIALDQNGDVSRKTVMRFLGSAYSACLSHGHLILFCHDMVEIREVKSGRLRQIIPGKEVRLLDNGGNFGGKPGEVRAAALKTVKFCMQHPDYQKMNYIVLELLLAETIASGDPRLWI